VSNLFIHPIRLLYFYFMKTAKILVYGKIALYGNIGAVCL